MESQAAEQPKEVEIKPNQTLDFKEHKQGLWDFYHSSYPMSNSKQLDQVSDMVSTMGLPEVFYGNNHFYAVLPSKNILVEFCGI